MDYVLFKDARIPARLAITQTEQEKGLMYETQPQAMVFVYPEKRFLQYWMKNTPLPLDIIFINAGQVISIEKGVPYSTSLVGNVAADLVVEFPHGTARDLGLKLGDSIKLEYSKQSLNRLLHSKVFAF